MIARSSLLIALMAVPVAYGCDCSEPTVQESKKRSTVVFRGTIIALRDTAIKSELNGDGETGKIVVFRVTRVWKGNVGTMFEMPGVLETSACWGFAASRFLTIGNDLLVYASRFPGGVQYFTNICSRTRFVKYAAKDLEELGPGEEPKASVRRPSSK
jgi:hypothetical protein